MKRSKLLAILMSLAMVFTMVPIMGTSVYADESYTVTIDMNSGEIYDQMTEERVEKTSTYLSPGNTQEVPSKDWMKQEIENGNHIKAPANSEYIEDESCTVTIDMNGGKIYDQMTEKWVEKTSMDLYPGYSQDVPSKDWMEREIEDGNYIKAPADSEYIGVEITDKEGAKTYDPGAEYTVISEATIKVLWKSTTPDSKTSTITYNLNGGTMNGKTGTVTVKAENGTTIILPEPTRDGYTFTYWQGSKYYAGDKYTVKGDHTLTAQWEKAPTDSTESDSSNNGNKSGNKSSGAKTGDDSNLAMWSLMLISSITAMAVLAITRARRRRNSL